MQEKTFPLNIHQTGQWQYEITLRDIVKHLTTRSLIQVFVDRHFDEMGWFIDPQERLRTNLEQQAAFEVELLGIAPHVFTGERHLVFVLSQSLTREESDTPAKPAETKRGCKAMLKERENLMKRSADVLIIGGGIIGCSIAYFLRKQGVEVIVLEKGEIGAQASSAAAGLLAPIRPLSQRDPFKTLQLTGLARFSSFVPELEAVSRMNVGYEKTGTLRLLPAEKIVPAQTWAETWQHAGYHIEILTPEETYKRESLLFAGLHGAISIADEAQVVPVQFVQAFAQAALNLGALFYIHTEVVALHRSETGKRIAGLWTDHGDLLTCNQLIIATGAWSSQWGTWLDVTLPVRPVRGELIAFQQPSPQVQHILFDEGVFDEDLYLTPKPNGTLVVGATKAEVGFDTLVSEEGASHLRTIAVQIIPALTRAHIQRMWAGLRPKTPDSRPLLGPIPFWENVIIASGHGGFGILLSVITGETISELVMTGEVPEIIRPFVLKKTSRDPNEHP